MEIDPIITINLSSSYCKVVFSALVAVEARFAI
jgi:hypothetical protein